MRYADAGTADEHANHCREHGFANGNTGTGDQHADPARHARGQLDPDFEPVRDTHAAADQYAAADGDADQ